MNDNRYRVAHKEAVIGVIVVIINFLLWYGFAYGLGSGDPTKYHFIMGLPEWFFYSCIVCSLIMFILIAVVIKFFFKEIAFDEEDGSEQ